MEKVRRRRRRRHVRAFGEWNNNYGDEPWLQAGGGVVMADQDACSEAWFSYPGAPPACKQAVAPVKARRAASNGAAPGRHRGRSCDGRKGRLQEEAEAASRRLRASDDGGVAAATPAKAVRAMRRPVVDTDLYGRLPPPDCASQRPRKRVVKSMWMGCLGLNCVA